MIDRRLFCIYDKCVTTFDPKKSKLNQDKHGVVLESCEEALDGGMLSEAKRHEQKAYFQAYPHQ